MIPVALKQGFTLIEVLIGASILGIVGVLAYAMIYGESNHDMCARRCQENRANDFGTCLTVCEVAADGRDSATAASMSAGVAAGIAAGSAGRR